MRLGGFAGDGCEVHNEATYSLQVPLCNELTNGAREVLRWGCCGLNQLVHPCQLYTHNCVLCALHIGHERKVAPHTCRRPKDNAVRSPLGIDVSRWLGLRKTISAHNASTNPIRIGKHKTNLKLRQRLQAVERQQAERHKLSLKKLLC
jgi:hypothetical protein